MLHITATVQLRNATEGRAHYQRKAAAGKTPNEAMRRLKRRLSDIVYKTILDDLVANKATGPGGHSGTTRQSSVRDLTPDIGPSEKPHHGPATTKPRTPHPAPS